MNLITSFPAYTLPLLHLALKEKVQTPSLLCLQISEGLAGFPGPPLLGSLLPTLPTLEHLECFKVPAPQGLRACSSPTGMFFPASFRTWLGSHLFSENFPDPSPKSSASCHILSHFPVLLLPSIQNYYDFIFASVFIHLTTIFPASTAPSTGQKHSAEIQGESVAPLTGVATGF